MRPQLNKNLKNVRELATWTSRRRCSRQREEPVQSFKVKRAWHARERAKRPAWLNWDEQFQLVGDEVTVDTGAQMKSFGLYSKWKGKSLHGFAGVI